MSTDGQQVARDGKLGTVLILQKRYHPNSIGLVRGLQAYGYKVAMIVQSVGSVEDWSDCEPLVVPYHRWTRLLRGGKRLPKYGTPRLLPILRAIRELRPDIVIVKKGRAAQVAAAAIARVYGARIVILRDSPPSEGSARPTPFIQDRVLQPNLRISTSPGAVASNPAPASTMPGGYVFLPYPVEAKEMKPLSLPKSRTQVLSVGAFSNARKRLDWVRKAVAAAELDDQVDCTFIGTGSENSDQITEIRETEARHDLRRSTVRPNLPFAELQALYPNYDLLVLATNGEAFGAVIVEAMAAGLPVLISDTCGARGCMRDGIDGLIFDTHDLGDMTEKLAMLVNNEEMREQMGRNAAQHAQETLAPEGWARAFTELLNENDRAAGGAE